jgi:hypothetical protein
MRHGQQRLQMQPARSINPRQLYSYALKNYRISIFSFKGLGSSQVEDGLELLPRVAGMTPTSARRQHEMERQAIESLSLCPLLSRQHSLIISLTSAEYSELIS